MLTIFLMGLVVIGLHEAGHIVSALLLRLNVKRIGISTKGVYIVREPGSPAANMMTTLAGPGANFLAAIILREHYEFATMNLMFGLINMLPITGSDGQRAWNQLTRGISRPAV
jgi:Zn-dependent protease